MNDRPPRRRFLMRSLSMIAFLTAFVAGFRYVLMPFEWRDVSFLDGQNGIIIGMFCLVAVFVLFAKVVFGVAGGLVALLIVRVFEKFLEPAQQNSQTIADSADTPD